MARARLVVIGLLLVIATCIPSAASAQAATYVVQPGDNLTWIAAARGTTVNAIVQANGLPNADAIRPGMRLVIPTGNGKASGSSAPTTGTTYVVAAGDNLSAIAKKYGVSVASIVQANGLADADAIRSGMRLVIPSGSVTGTANVTNGSSTYLVRAGDSLSGIASKYGVTITALMQANSLRDPDAIYTGMKLLIPTGASSAATSGASAAGAPNPGAPSTTSGARTYNVNVGDSLSGIASSYGVTVAAIVQANGLSSAESIQAGTTLKIPAATGAAVAGPPSPASAVASGSGSRFEVSISQQSCWLYGSAGLIGHWACSTGRAGSRTIPGTYKVRDKLARAWGGTWGWWLPYWLGIYPVGSLENGIHGLPYSSATGQKNWGNLIGTPVSYGCVVLSDAAAQVVYTAAFVGMPVIIRP